MCVLRDDDFWNFWIRRFQFFWDAWTCWRGVRAKCEKEHNLVLTSNSETGRWLLSLCVELFIPLRLSVFKKDWSLSFSSMTLPSLASQQCWLVGMKQNRRLWISLTPFRRGIPWDQSSNLEALRRLFFRNPFIFPWRVSRTLVIWWNHEIIYVGWEGKKRYCK